jgi:hypothetical protein
MKYSPHTTDEMILIVGGVAVTAAFALGAGYLVGFIVSLF